MPTLTRVASSTGKLLHVSKGASFLALAGPAPCGLVAGCFLAHPDSSDVPSAPPVVDTPPAAHGATAAAPPLLLPPAAPPLFLPASSPALSSSGQSCKHADIVSSHARRLIPPSPPKLCSSRATIARSRASFTRCRCRRSPVEAPPLPCWLGAPSPSPLPAAGPPPPSLTMRGAASVALDAAGLTDTSVVVVVVVVARADPPCALVVLAEVVRGGPPCAVEGPPCASTRGHGPNEECGGLPWDISAWFSGQACTPPLFIFPAKVVTASPADITIPNLKGPPLIGPAPSQTFPSCRGQALLPSCNSRPPPAAEP